ncbi:endonuclease/exonuclease/phosphatase family protein [Methylobacterium radiodurans]|uniref:Endonuclease n=1 Tax=Methylobacterium radiodurans TaxID=2202828 RepID=A0A2U8VSL8_9HYPH|nr:endonuclease/exonuclease/phosphatase family protein [Methylobacterium radiodurans]AWN36743.1 endonuclease [Methylobacterium radiodurans]
MIRLLSYNIRHGLGLDGRIAPERIAAVIGALAPDIVALQEVDVGRRRTDGRDQAEVIATALRMEQHFHPALHVEGERYGDAILTPHPSRLVRAAALPGHPRRLGLEPRGALWVEVTVGGRRLQVFNTHLGLTGGERLAQVAALLGPDWLGSPACRDPVVLLGDLNATPWSRAYRRLAGRLTDARRLSGERRARSGATFPARLPLLRIDHVFVGPGIAVERMGPAGGALARLASDHRPLLAEIVLAPVAAAQERQAETGSEVVG